MKNKIEAIEFNHGKSEVVIKLKKRMPAIGYSGLELIKLLIRWVIKWEK